MLMWKMVPVEPTEDMALAAVKASLRHPSQINGLHQWAAMLAAAPPAPVAAPQFPTMLRKMWSGTEVQQWIDEHWPASDSDPNAPWLTLAHNVCTDAGVEQGQITDRLNALQKVIENLREDVFRAQRAAPVAAEPVAWLIEERHRGGVTKFCTTQPQYVSDRECTKVPLYTAPPPPQAPVQAPSTTWTEEDMVVGAAVPCVDLRPEPLSDEEIDALINAQHWPTIPGGPPVMVIDRPAARAFARAILEARKT